MIRINGRLATYGEIWFDEPPPDEPGVDVLMFRRRSSPIDGQACVPFKSLVNDLSASDEALFAALGHTNRYKIKRAASKDGLSGHRFTDPRPYLARFRDFYDEFARQKGLEPAYRAGLSAACDAGQLALSHASRDGQTLVWHAYLTHGDKVTLLHSASLFREMASGDRALLARANRWLHWRDMLDFRQSGFHTYDWGGLFHDETDPGRLGINNFKREFGGRVVCTYDCNLAVTLWGSAYLATRKVLQHLKTF